MGQTVMHHLNCSFPCLCSSSSLSCLPRPATVSPLIPQTHLKHLHFKELTTEHTRLRRMLHWRPASTQEAAATLGGDDDDDEGTSGSSSNTWQVLQVRGAMLLLLL